MEVFLARQPIFTAEKKVFGYELLFRIGLENYFPDVDGDTATSNLISNIIFPFDFKEIMGGKPGLINFTRDLILQKARIKRFSALLSISIICLVSLLFLFSCATPPPQKSRLENRISIYLDRLESSAVDLQHELEKIAAMKRLNTADRMKKALSAIKSSENTLKRANQDRSDYIAFINNNSRELKKENLNHYIHIRTLLDQPLSCKRQAISDYFHALEEWLSYSATHFKRLEAKDQAARNSYDQLSTNVNRSLKLYDTANEKYHQFVNDFLTRNPDLKKQFKQEYKTMKKELGWM